MLWTDSSSLYKGKALKQLVASVEAEEDATGSGRSRPKGVVEEDVVQSLCDGVQV